MSLTRIRKVFVCLQALIQASWSSPLDDENSVKQRPAFSFDEICIITVAGTNGKGSTCRFIEECTVQAGYSTGVYASPHIERFNERIRINAQEASDEIICEGFAWVEKARLLANKEHVNEGHDASITLSYFEYATLCAFAQFMLLRLKVWVLEVGLGGRLDATNIVDANVAVITSIGLDHQSYLGDTTEQIASEKAGIIKGRQSSDPQSVIIGYDNAHDSVLAIIKQHQVSALMCGTHFGRVQNSIDGKIKAGLSKTNSGWLAIDGKRFEFALQDAKLPAQNIMTALAALSQISKRLNWANPATNKHVTNKHEQTLLLPHTKLQTIINTLTMPGRMQVLQHAPLIVVDVGHNEAAAEYVVARVQQIDYARCHIVIGMLKDKNVEDTIRALAQIDAQWYCVSLGDEISAGRGEKADRLLKAVNMHTPAAKGFDSLAQGLKEAVNSASTNDIILCIGSFVLASECMLMQKK